MAGFFRHATHQGETSLASQEKWVKAIYPIGLLYLTTVAITLGFWGWAGAMTIGIWWLAIPVNLLAAGFALLVPRVLVRLPPGNVSSQWTRILQIEGLYRLLTAIYNLLRRIADILTTAFEGEGGLLWSYLLMVLIYSILSTNFP